MVEITGIDHLYISVSDICISESFYDKVLIEILGFRKNNFSIDNDNHIQYYNRHFGFVLRPARSNTMHNSYAPGLHHFCFRVESEADVYNIYKELVNAGIETTEAKRFPEYAHDYVSTVFKDPDGLQLEITNYRQERKDRHDNW